MPPRRARSESPSWPWSKPEPEKQRLAKRPSVQRKLQYLAEQQEKLKNLSRYYSVIIDEINHVPVNENGDLWNKADAIEAQFHEQLALVKELRDEIKTEAAMEYQDIYGPPPPVNYYPTPSGSTSRMRGRKPKSATFRSTTSHHVRGSSLRCSRDPLTGRFMSTKPSAPRGRRRY